jgi:HK97 family phage portal protein
MGVLRDLFRGSGTKATQRNAPQASSEGVVVVSLSDPRVVQFMCDGLMTASGFTVNVETALRNPSMFRAVSLISNSIGMLPLHLISQETKKKAKDHPLYRILHRKPNSFQTAFDFRAMMQLRALVHKNAYALILRSTNVRTGKRVVTGLVPLDPRRMEAKLGTNWQMQYIYQPTDGPRIRYPAEDIFRLRGMSVDGINGFSLVEQAKEAIGLALSAELAAGRIFKNGSFISGVIQAKEEMSDDAYERLKTSWAELHTGAEKAGSTPILEGAEYKVSGSTAREAQMAELRKLQVEEIARVSGVPRPLLMVDETSWGSGIEALGQFFVAYALSPWFEAWQQAIERCLLDEEDAELYAAKFNPGALLRGSLKDQADYLAKAMGAGGHQGWIHYDEARDTMDLPEREAPVNPMMSRNGSPPLEEDPPAPNPKPKPAPKQDDDDDE